MRRLDPTRHDGRTVALAATALLCAGITAAQDAEALAPRVLQELRARSVTCPEDLSDGWTCGQYRNDFSRLKFELEVELDLREYDARPLTAWRLHGGNYERSWAVHGQKITMKFGRTSHVVALQQGPLDEEAGDDATEEPADDPQGPNDD